MTLRNHLFAYNKDHCTCCKCKAKWQKKLSMKNLKINRDQYLKRLHGLVFGEDPRQGYTENNTFYHPTLRFQFPVPSNWKIQNTQTVIRIMNEKKDAMIMFTISSARSPSPSISRLMAR